MKRISSGTVTVAVLAIVLGLVAVYFVRQAMNRKPEPVAAKPKETGIAVVVPRINLPKNSRIRAQDLAVIRVADGKVPSGAILTAAVAADRVVKAPLTAGQPILDENLYGIGELPSLADRLPVGFRAVPITVANTHSGRELVRAGSYVDIAWTVEGDHPGLGGDNGLGTKTLLRNVRVLSTVGTANARVRQGTIVGLTNMTVAVNPKQANELILAQRKGTLSVTLCSSKDAESGATDANDQVINARQLLGLVDPPPPVPAPQPYKVEVWRGGEMRTLEFGPERMKEAGMAPKTEVLPVSAPPAVQAPVKQPTAVPAVAPSAKPQSAKASLKKPAAAAIVSQPPVLVKDEPIVDEEALAQADPQRTEADYPQLDDSAYAEDQDVPAGEVPTESDWEAIDDGLPAKAAQPTVSAIAPPAIAPAMQAATRSFTFAPPVAVTAEVKPQAAAKPVVEAKPAQSSVAPVAAAPVAAAPVALAPVSNSSSLSIQSRIQAKYYGDGSR